MSNNQLATMSPNLTNSSDFYFEISSHGEHTTFKEVEGISTETVLRNHVHTGENPFKFRIPSLPKTQNLVLKGGNAQAGSKLVSWCAEAKNPEVPTHKDKVALTLKDAKGNSLVEWTLHSAHPTANKMAAGTEPKQPQHLEDLQLAYSFFTLAKK